MKKPLLESTSVILIIISLAHSTDPRKDLQPVKRSRIEPAFEDQNLTTVIGTPGGEVVLPCNIFMIQDHTVSWIHVTEKGLDLLTTGNSTYTLEPRITSSFAHPSNWRLKITELKPEDAGTYLCQISTFPPKVKLVYLEIHGPMIKIVRDQIVYNAGSNIEVSCIYRNSTKKPNKKMDALELMKEMALIGTQIPPNVITWLYNDNTFSQRNRRRVKTVQMRGFVESKLSIKSAIIQDSGNYSCLLQNTPQIFDTLRITVVDGEHSAAIYKNSKKIPNESSGSPPAWRLLSILAQLGYCILFKIAT